MKWFCKHDWPRWGQAKDQSVSGSTSRKIQTRVCLKCGLIKIRKIAISTYTGSVTINALEGEED